MPFFIQRVVGAHSPISLARIKFGRRGFSPDSDLGRKQKSSWLDLAGKERQDFG